MSGGRESKGIHHGAGLLYCNAEVEDGGDEEAKGSAVDVTARPRVVFIAQPIYRCSLQF